MLDKAQAIAPELIRLRREIHAHPELAFQEVRTAQLVVETLREIGGIDIRTGVGKTGVVGQLGTATDRRSASVPIWMPCRSMRRPVCRLLPGIQG